MEKYFGRGRFGLGIVVVMMGVFLGLWANWAEADTGNILRNPGAEGSSAWTNDGTGFTITGLYGPHSGSKLFYGGDNNSSSRMYQWVLVSEYAKAIDDGQVWAHLYGYAKGDEDDEGRLDLLFGDLGVNNLFAEYSTGYHNLPPNWGTFAPADNTYKPLNSGTRQVGARMQANRRPGNNNNNVYFDDLSLTLKAPELEVIEPAVVTLYEAIDYGGRPLIITSNNPNLSDNLFENVASSIKVPAGFKATLYKDTNYGGVPSLVRTSDDSTLVDEGWNDRTVSIKVEGTPKFDFGNVYLATNDSTKDYNRPIKKIFEFKNAGHTDTKLKWSISSTQGWIKFSQSSGTLTGGQIQEIEVWLEPTDGEGTYNGIINFTSTRGDVEVAVTAKAYKTAQLSYVGPDKGPNGKVNVALDESVGFEVTSNKTISHPNAQWGGYMWKNNSDFEKSPDAKRVYSWNQSGDYMIYCKTYETTNGKEVQSDALSIPIRVWIRPTVNNTPPQSAIDSASVSWYDGKYVGVKGEPVYLMADGQKGSDEPGETITKYIWDFDNNWATIELEQPAGQVKARTWDNVNLSGNIRCKAVTNYGVQSYEKNFSLKIYDSMALDAKGPYTGKPNKPLELASSINGTAYPGATYQYQWRVNCPETRYDLKNKATEKGTWIEETSIVSSGILKGNATQISTATTLKGDAVQKTGYIELTPNLNNKSGQVEYSNLNLGNEKWSVEGEFWTGGGNGADAFYIYAFANETPQGYYDSKGQYSIGYNEYEDQIQLMYNGTILATVTQTGLDDSAWHQFRVEYYEGEWEIYLDDNNESKLYYDDFDNYATRTTNKLFGFGATTGGLNNYHRVRNMKWYNTLGTTMPIEECTQLTSSKSGVNGQVEYSNLNPGEHWRVSGEFRTGGGNNGGEAFYIYAYANQTPNSEDDAKNQYSINYDEFQNQIQLKYNGINLKSVSGYNNEQWLQFKVIFEKGKFQVYLDDVLRLDYTDPDYLSRDKSGTLFGFGARTGGANNYHQIRNGQWYKRIRHSEDAYIQLTPNQIENTNGHAEYANLPLDDKWSVSGEFWSGDGSGGDAFFIYAFAKGTPEYYYTDKGQYSINYSERDDQIQLKYNGVTLSTVAQSNIDNSQWRQFAVRCDRGVFQIYLDHRLRLECDDRANYATRTTNKLFGFGARTGASTNEHRVRNMKWSVGTTTATDGQGKAKYTGTESGTYRVEAEAVITTAEGLVLLDIASTTVTLDAGKPTAMPGGPYRGGIKGGNYSPIQFSGNSPDYVESEEVGTITEWDWTFPDYGSATIYNPTYAFDKAGKYTVNLKVRSKYGKWSFSKTTEVNVIDGKIAGYVRAADLRTPVGSVTLTLSSSHVDKNVLAQIASSDEKLYTNDDGSIWTLTDEKGGYVFEHIPLGSYRIRASKGEGDNAHEFQTAIKVTEITLDAPNQLAIDFVDISVYPVGGRIIYSIQKNGMDVLVEDVKVKAQPVGAPSLIESLPSNKSLSATGVNYSMPLFAGKYLFVAERQGHSIRIKESTPGYDSKTQLVTIKDARTDIDFIDSATRKLTVFVQDSGEYKIASKTVTISGDNGQAEGISDETDGKFRAVLNPGKYTVKVQGASPEEKEVDITAGDEAIKMTIPSKIEITISPRPKLLDVPDEFLKQFGLKPEDNPEGYMYYYEPEPRTHKYTIKATSNGHPVEDFTLFVTDEVSMMTPDPPEEQELFVKGKEGEYIMTAGLPKKTTDDPPLAGTKTIKFRAEKDNYTDSDKVEDTVIVLGDVLEGSAAKIVSIPTINYTVLHDPPGDGSYSFLDDSMSIKGIIRGMDIKINDKEIPVYPSPWSKERMIEGKEYSDNNKYKGLLGYQDSESTVVPFIWGAALESVTGAINVVYGPVGYAFQFIKLGAKVGALNINNDKSFVQYEVSPKWHLETPSGDELPDLVGPGKGDVYYGEGWTLGLQTKYRLGIQQVGTDTEGNVIWELTTETVETYDILERTNQYIYTIRDIENVINDLSKTIADIQQDLDEEEQENGTGTAEYKKMSGEKNKLEGAKTTWDNLLKENLAYVWNRDYLTKGKSFEDFKKDKGGELKDGETLIFSAGPTFEYSRTISQDHTVSYSQEVTVDTSSEMGHEFVAEVGFKLFGSGPSIKLSSGSTAGIGSGVSFGSSWESGQSTEQSVGFVLNDDDVGDNYSTRVYADPRWGTPIFFQDPGSISSDPWEKGTNKAVDYELSLIQEPSNTGPFDYHDGAHYKVEIKYTGLRELESATVDASIYAFPYYNQDNLTALFNGQPGPLSTFHAKSMPSIIVAVDLYPPAIDQNNSEEKEYSVGIEVDEIADAPQIYRVLTLKPKFADLRAPRAVITEPYAGQRISPALFPADDPFKVQVVSSDMDIASIQLQIRTKQPDGVWEPWRNLSGMKWEGTNTDKAVLFEYLDRKPPRREFTFKWSEAEIKTLGVGEYALRAVAVDKATKPNTDLDPPDVVFLVDESKPSVLTTIPDYQASEAERIYRGELSVLFTDDMRAMDFTDRTFLVSDLLENNKQVAGYVSYSPALRKATFVPIVPFTPYGYYRVEIKTDVKKTVGTTTTIERGVHDLAGNPLDNAFMWTFRTKDAPFEQTWSIGLSVTDGVALDGNNIAGVEYGASDGTDEKDAPSVPGMAYQMRLSYLDKQRQEFDRDMRPADGRLSHHWFFVVDNAKKYATVTLSWQPSLLLTKTTRQYQVMRLVEFDSNGKVTNNISLDPTKVNTNPQTGDPELTEIYSYVNKGELSRYFRLDVQKIDFVANSFKQGSSGWRFFSTPVTPQRAEPFVNLGDDIDPFKLYQYKTDIGGYKIYPFDIGEVALQTGNGYWTRIEKDVVVDVGGASNSNDMSFELNTAGWQAIGNPFILPVNVTDLQFRQGTSTAVLFEQAVSDGLIEGTLYRWDIVTKDEQYRSEWTILDSYEAATVNSKLEPWEGYWLKTKKPNIVLTIPAPTGVGTATVETPDYLKPPQAPKLLASKQTVPSPQFNLCVEVFSDGVSDRSTILGTNQEARLGQDAFDSTEPPVMGQTVAAYFEHADWGNDAGMYNQDYQPAMNIDEQRTWQLTVYTDKPNTRMTVSWEKSIRQVPPDIMLSFRKVGETTWQDMRQTNKKEFVSDSRITEIKYEVQAKRIEMAAPLAGGTRLLPCYPNPFNTGVWIPYELAQDSAVEIRIYNIAGELVRTLDEGMKLAGTNNTPAYWNGCNNEGEKVASGIYFYVFKAGNFTAVRKMGVCR